LERFPTNMLNKMFGFKPRPFFTAASGAEKAPEVKFDFSSKPATTPATSPVATP
jgi:LemA protein